jgi:hypothetical protein
MTKTPRADSLSIKASRKIRADDGGPARRDQNGR